jgi:8-oxo-dGTP diphosphatase
MDWTNWKPRERANLCFIVKGGRVLLIHKKRGLGAGKINAPGGKIEPNESALKAAIRETIEEVRVVPLDPNMVGELLFQFLDGYSLHCTVFLSRDCEGEGVETEEAIPFWCELDEIPYAKMWADDEHWLPLLFAGEKFRGYFTFDGETLVTRHIDLVPDFSCREP